MKELKVLLLEPRGFCAGVTRAVKIVERALEIFPTPIYIKNEIVHNKTVVNSFKEKGIIFVNSLEEVPNNSVIIFSAHGVSQLVEDLAHRKNLKILDATCPLVKKIHKESYKYYTENSQIILVGHKGHPEVEGTLGRIPKDIFLVSTKQDAQNLILDDNRPINYITQTTLSIHDTKDIIDILRKKFSKLQGQDSKNICYATQNRQNAVSSIINQVEGLIIVGSKNSSNSNRLKEIGDKNNKPSFLIDNKDQIPFTKLENITSIALSAGASAPEEAIKGILNALQERRKATIIVTKYVTEDIIFHLPKELR